MDYLSKRMKTQIRKKFCGHAVREDEVTEDDVSNTIKNGVLIPPSSHFEPKVPIQSFKNNKIAGIDGLPARLFKAGGFKHGSH